MTQNASRHGSLFALSNPSGSGRPTIPHRHGTEVASALQVAVETFPGGPLEVQRDVDEAGLDEIFATITSK